MYMCTIICKFLYILCKIFKSEQIFFMGSSFIHGQVCNAASKVYGLLVRNVCSTLKQDFVNIYMYFVSFVLMYRCYSCYGDRFSFVHVNGSGLLTC